jgi:hypothetical protein
VLLENNKKEPYTPLTLFSQITHVQITGLKVCLNSSLSKQPFEMQGTKRQQREYMYDCFHAHFIITYMQARTTKVSRQQKSATQKQRGGGTTKSNCSFCYWSMCDSCTPHLRPNKQRSRQIAWGPPNDNFLLDQVRNPKVWGGRWKKINGFVCWAQRSKDNATWQIDFGCRNWPNSQT